jgi:hypothetical protein
MKLVVIGDDSTTTVANNSDAAIAIVNTNQTAGNLAGLHFARADTDDSPNYSGAAIVAQFPDAQVTGQYPKGRLHFNTSTSANTAPSTKMTIDESGNVGIGVLAPTELLHLNANNPEFTMQAATDGGECAIYFKDDDGNKDGRITYRTDYSGQTDNFMDFYTNGTQRLKIEGGGDIRVATAGRIVNEGGIFLGGTASANHLDDYEEGTWTPSFENTIHPNPTVTYTSQIGTYTKVGNRVHWTATIRWSAFTANGSGYVKLVGFPFTSVSTTAFTQGANVFGYANGIGGSDSLQGAYIDPSTNFFLPEYFCQPYRRITTQQCE